ncbi:MAG: ABC transporter ATP-binding protein [Acidimicrobiia bacterium]
MAVELRGVTKRFSEVTAVDDLTLEIRHGEFFSLLGPSGCGKTTTLRMIAGLEFPSEGSIRIFGEEMGLRPPNRRPVNTVFQSYALFPHMTVARNVAFGLEMRKLTPQDIAARVENIIQIVQLTGMEQRKPAQLSGGQQQRVALARALVNSPKVLLLDEPLGALDLKLRQAMQLELKALQERVGITFVYVTHDQEEALTMSDRIGVMNRGKLLQVGTPEDIYEGPANRFVADFIGETSFLPAIVQGPGEVMLADGTVVQVPTEAGPGAEVTVALRPERVQVFPAGFSPDGDRNAVPARVLERVYMGTSTFYDLELGGARLRVRQDHSPSAPRFQPGEQVVAVWEAASARVLER